MNVTASDCVVSVSLCVSVCVMCVSVCVPLSVSLSLTVSNLKNTFSNLGQVPIAVLQRSRFLCRWLHFFSTVLVPMAVTLGAEKFERFFTKIGRRMAAVTRTGRSANKITVKRITHEA